MVICLAFGLVAGVISAFLSANIIKEHKFKDIACAASFFMCVQFVSSVVAFASFFFIGAKVSREASMYLYIERLSSKVTLTFSPDQSIVWWGVYWVGGR